MGQKPSSQRKPRSSKMAAEQQHQQAQQLPAQCNNADDCGAGDLDHKTKLKRAAHDDDDDDDDKQASVADKQLASLAWLSQFGDKNDSPVEVGAVRFMKASQYDEAVKLAQQTQKPLFLLFQEIPGCRTCTNFGALVLRDPLLVEAIETLFVPVLVRNNESRDTADGQLLRRFGEPAWNNPVVRFLHPDTAADLVPREDGVWAPLAVKQRMVAALEAMSDARVPSYLQRHLSWTRDDVQPFTVSMPCFWTGERGVGALQGVVHTQCGFVGSAEVVTAWFDKQDTDFATLLSGSLASGCGVAAVYPHTASHEKAARETHDAASGNAASGVTVRARVDKLPSSAPDSDQKHSLRRGPLRAVPLTPWQQTVLNASEKGIRGDRKTLERALSPRQLQLWDALASLPASVAQRLPAFAMLNRLSGSPAAAHAQFSQALDRHMRKLAEALSVTRA